MWHRHCQPELISTSMSSPSEVAAYKTITDSLSCFVQIFMQPSYERW